MLQYSVVTALGSHTLRLIEQFSKAIADCGCNIDSCRYMLAGSESTLSMLVSGSWDAIAKMEDMLPKLERKLQLRIHAGRTTLRKPGGKLMPYVIDLVCADRPGIVYEITNFMVNNDIQIEDFHTNTYKAAHTETQMFSLHMIIHIPTDISLAVIRGEFLGFCDRLNLDAIMEPVK